MVLVSSWALDPQALLSWHLLRCSFYFYVNYYQECQQTLLNLSQFFRMFQIYLLFAFSCNIDEYEKQDMKDMNEI